MLCEISLKGNISLRYFPGRFFLSQNCDLNEVRWPLITPNFVLKTRRDRQCCKKMSDRGQREKNKFLHEAKLLFWGIFSDLWAPDFFAPSLADIVLSARVGYNEEHFADSVSVKTISCACTYICYYSAYLHFCCGFPNCNYVYISL